MPKTAKKPARTPRAEKVDHIARIDSTLQFITQTQEKTIAVLTRLENLVGPKAATNASDDNLLHTTPLDVEQVFGRIAGALETIAKAMTNLPAPVAAPAPRTRKPATPEAPPAEPAKTEPKPPEQTRGGFSLGDCVACGVKLDRENTSTTSTGRVVHIGCPGKKEEAPATTEAVAAETTTAGGRKIKIVDVEEKAEPAAEKKPEEKPAAPTFEQLREAALAFLVAHGGGGDADDKAKAAAKQALAKVIADHGGGAAKLSDIVDDKKAAVLAALKA